MAPPTRTCLGTRLVVFPLENTTATLLVEYATESLEIKLLTTTRDSYQCTLSISDVSRSSILGEITDSEKLLALGKLLLRENDDENGLLQNLTSSFQFQYNENNDEHNQTIGIVLLVHENLSNGMKRRLVERKLEFMGSGLEYAVAVGEVLNQALHEIQQLQSARDHWKTTATDLANMQQKQKDALLANFTTLRNKLFKQHQTDIEELELKLKLELKAAHGKASSKKQASKQKREPSPELEHGDLFVNDHVVALAQGRKLDVARPVTAKRSVQDAVDMVHIRNQGLEYQRRKPQKRKSNNNNNESTQKRRNNGRPTTAAAAAMVEKPPKKSLPPRNDDDSTASESSWTLK